MHRDDDQAPAMGMIGIRDRVAPVPDTRLLTMAASGDADAFDMLLRPRLDRLFRIAVAIVRSEADARDALQEASIHAWRQLPRLRDHDRFDAWLTQIVVNACRTSLRQRRRVTIREIAVDEVSGVPDAEPGHPGAVAGFADTEAIRGAFERLDPQTRSLLVLHYVDERPLAEIGRILGSPTGTIKWRLWRARRALAHALQAERR